MEYTLEDIEKIKSEGFPLSLEQNILDIITKLSQEVSSPEYTITPQFKKHSDKWVRDKPVKKKITKNDFEVCVDNIRTSLNKVTKQTYETQLNVIITNIKTILASDYSKLDNLELINGIIYNIVSSNNFYSELYAKLYKELIIKYNFIDYYFNNKLRLINENINSIEYCDPDEDYDKFCDINKINEKRRSLILFYVNLMKLDTININNISNLRVYIQEKIKENISLDNKISIVDELANILHMLITNYFTKNLTEFDKITSYLNEIISLNKSKYPSLSNKAKFKHMDIIDFMNKSNKD